MRQPIIIVAIGDRRLLLKELIALRDDSARAMKILLSSRDNINLAQWLEGATELRLQASLTQADIQHFIGHCVSTAVDNKHPLDGAVDSCLRSQLESHFSTDRMECESCFSEMLLALPFCRVIY
jgi:hypothetical protein